MIAFIENDNNGNKFNLLRLKRSTFGSWWWIYVDHKDAFAGEPFTRVEDAERVLEMHCNQHQMRYVIVDKQISEVTTLTPIEVASDDSLS